MSKLISTKNLTSLPKGIKRPKALAKLVLVALEKAAWGDEG